MTEGSVVLGNLVKNYAFVRNADWTGSWEVIFSCVICYVFDVWYDFVLHYIFFKNDIYVYIKYSDIVAHPFNSKVLILNALKNQNIIEGRVILCISE